MLGEHTDEVLTRVAGLSPEEIARLRDAKVLDGVLIYHSPGRTPEKKMGYEYNPQSQRFDVPESRIGSRTCFSPWAPRS